jgi:hypothetical protein
MINKGIITEKEITELKEAYPGEALFKWTSPNKKDELVLRAISHDLMQRIVNMIKDAELQGKGLPIQDVNEKIFDACVLWPSFKLEEKLNLPVGVIPSVVKVIQEKSGFIDIDIFQRVLGPDTFTSTLKDFDTWNDITDEEAEALKKEVGVFSLFRVRIGKWVFIIRPMTRIDIQVASQANDDQLALAKSVTMWPKEVKWETIPAGIIEILGRQANEISGWEPDAEVQEL